MVILNILIFVLILGIIVVIHELGHYIFARRAGILVHEFSVGMGPLVYQKKKDHIKYSLRAIPLGGYVSMSGETVNESLVKKGDTVGLSLNAVGNVDSIILDDTYEKEITGVISDLDLYGKDYKELYIVLNTPQGETRYAVERQAKYLYKKKQEMLITPHESSFESKGWWARFLTIFAGPLMNFILAILVLFVVALVQGQRQSTNVLDNEGVFEKGDIVEAIDGHTVTSWQEIVDVIKLSTDGYIDVVYLRNSTVYTVELPVVYAFQSLGFTSDVEGYQINQLMIGNVGGRAQGAGLQKGDILRSIKIGEGTELVVSSWEELIDFVKANDGGKVTLEVSREGSLKQISYDVLKNDTLDKLGTAVVDYAVNMAPETKFSFSHLFVYPFTKMADDIGSMFNTLGLLFNPNSGVGLKDLSGPIGIFSLTSNAVSQGFTSVLIFIAFLSVNIGLINLLPIPALDGGRIVFLLYEAVTRRKVNRKFENMVNNIAFILLIALMIYVAFNDVLRLG